MFYYRTIITQDNPNTRVRRTRNENHMPKFIIERSVPGASTVPKNQLDQIGTGSEEVLKQMRSEGKDIAQERSFVAGNSIFCIYNAGSEDLIHEHGKRGNIPVTTVTEISAVIQHNTSSLS